MNNATITASDLQAIAAANIAATARDAAEGLAAEGWQGPGSTYDLGVYHGDREALAKRLGYEPTREQCRCLERQIRALLDAR